MEFVLFLTLARRLSRLVVTLLVVGALLLGWVAEELVFWLVLFAWAGLGAALGPPLILALYWKGTPRGGRWRGCSPVPVSPWSGT